MSTLTSNPAEIAAITLAIESDLNREKREAQARYAKDSQEHGGGAIVWLFIALAVLIGIATIASVNHG